MEYNNQLSENDKRFADEFSNYVNGKMASPRKVGKETVPSMSVAKAILDDMIEANKGYWPELH